MTILLDTNVVSELRKLRLGKADLNFARWAELDVVSGAFISAITVYELAIGCLLIERRNPPQAAIYRAWLESAVRPAFEGRILPLDDTVAIRAASLHVPSPKALNDSYIAATALVHGLTVITRNILDFQPMGVALFNPWTR